MKAMILAAGKGERLKPITENVPKPLFPVANIPIIRYNIEFLKSHGVKEFIINLYHLPTLIEQVLGDGSILGVKITYSFEEELWGTAGGLKLVESFFADDEMFILMNADNLVDFDLSEAIHFHKRHNADATMVLTKNADIKTYGAVEIDETMNVRNIGGRLDDIRESPRTAAVFSGIHILSPKVFEYIPPNINSCINAYAYPKMIKNGERVKGFITDGLWYDVGVPAKYYKTNVALLKRKIRLSYFDPFEYFQLKPEKEKTELACLGDNVELGEDIRFHPPFVVGHNVRIGDSTTIGPYAIIGDGTHISKASTIRDAIIFAGQKIQAGKTIAGQILGKKKAIEIPEEAYLSNDDEEADEQTDNEEK